MRELGLSIYGKKTKLMDQSYLPGYDNVQPGR
jgi:hypothetical protein